MCSTLIPDRDFFDLFRRPELKSHSRWVSLLFILGAGSGLLAATGCFSAHPLDASVAGGGEAHERFTVKEPVSMALAPLREAVSPGGSSFLVLRVAIPEGFWIGAAEGEVRSPGPTRMTVAADRYLKFGTPRWPAPRVEGIPVNLGVTRVYKGRVTALIPFTVAENCPDGPREVVVHVTYTPGLNAGHLTSHVDQPLRTKVVVRTGAPPGREHAPEPSMTAEATSGLRVEKDRADLPVPINYMLFPVSEDAFIAKPLHDVWRDPENHGKSIQMLMHPYAASGKNEGGSLGVGLAFINTTAEGIGTGMVDMSVFRNDYAGLTAAIDAVSCPGAYHNYRFNATYGGKEDRGVAFHLEDLTLDDGAWGYEIQTDVFEDGRFRFFGPGPRSKSGDESAFTRQEAASEFDAFLNVATNWRVGVGGRFRYVNVRDPARRLARDVPSVFDLFAGTPGLSGGSVAGARVTLVYDHRNQEFTPSRGGYARVRAEFDNSVDDQGEDGLAERWGRFEALGRLYFSTASNNYTLVLSNLWQLTTRDGIPFWEQPSVGGPETLRAFDSGRFVGRRAVSASVELRAQVLHIDFPGMPMDIELAPFVDAGQVFDDRLQGVFNVNPGVSMRVLNRPNIGLITNWAYGQDGAYFTGSLSLPF